MTERNPLAEANRSRLLEAQADTPAYIQVGRKPHQTAPMLTLPVWRQIVLKAGERVMSNGFVGMFRQAPDGSWNRLRFYLTHPADHPDSRFLRAQDLLPSTVTVVDGQPPSGLNNLVPEPVDMSSTPANTSVDGMSYVL